MCSSDLFPSHDNRGQGGFEPLPYTLSPNLHLHKREGYEIQVKKAFDLSGRKNTTCYRARHGMNSSKELDALVIIHNKPMKQTEKRPTTTKMNSQESMKDRKKTRTNFCLQHHYLAR